MSDAPVVCCDLDGVVWLGDRPIPGAAAGIAAIRAAGLRVAFITNNSGRPVADYVDRLAHHGIPAEPEDIVTSALVAADLLAGAVPGGSRILACAGPGVRAALADRGFEIVAEGPAAAVVVGWHDDFDFTGLRRAAAAIRAGARYVATNLDPTYPGAEGILPGAGSIAAAVTAAAGRDPEVAGKPTATAAAYVRRHLGPAGVMIGDRPSTDGDFAAVLGWPFALVLSGIAGPGGEEPVPDPAPAYVAADLGALAPSLIADFARAAEPGVRRPGPP